MEFNIGDKVIVNDETSFTKVIGKIGTIVKTREDNNYDDERKVYFKHYGIQIDDFEGHNLDGFLNKMNGYWVEDFALELCKNNNKINY